MNQLVGLIGTFFVRHEEKRKNNKLTFTLVYIIFSATSLPSISLFCSPFLFLVPALFHFPPSLLVSIQAISPLTLHLCAGLVNGNQCLTMVDCFIETIFQGSCVFVHVRVCVCDKGWDKKQDIDWRKERQRNWAIAWCTHIRLFM